MSISTSGPNGVPAGVVQADVQRYLRASSDLATTRDQLEQLESSEAVALFHQQLEVLQKRLLKSPQAFNDVFIADGTQAIAWAFRQDELSADFTKTLWELLLRGDDMSALLLRFIWNVPLKLKRKFIHAIDVHLSDRYPMFKGLSEGWPGQNGIPPYIRPPEERNRDFGLVNQGYLGYKELGYCAREVDLFVWLEVLRDKQCDDRPCEIGIAVRGKRAQGRLPGQDPHPRNAEPARRRQVPSGARTDRGLQPAAERHRPRLPAGTAVPGRVHHDRPADRDRPARMVPARAREGRQLERRAEPPTVVQPLGKGARSRRSRWSVPVPPA